MLRASKEAAVIRSGNAPAAAVESALASPAAMPLSVLEAGACGIPSVTTDVGACKEIIYGRSTETTGLGDGGIVVAMANPSAMAQAIIKLLEDEKFYRECSNTIRKRVEILYNKNEQISSYKELYDHYLKLSATRKAS